MEARGNGERLVAKCGMMRTTLMMVSGASNCLKILVAEVIVCRAKLYAYFILKTIYVDEEILKNGLCMRLIARNYWKYTRYQQVTQVHFISILAIAHPSFR
ncbi:hypothetical protein COOONC_04250 [Cooperia oncophora]